jgi:small subunit ribosomal protein S2
MVQSDFCGGLTKENIGYIMSKSPRFTIKELIEAGVHFGHKTMRWNPKMEPFIYGSRNGIHIIDLQKTAPLLNNALKRIEDIVAKNGRILFVGTKRQAQEPIAEAAARCGQHFINIRWLGGTLTNWKTVSGSIKKLINIEKTLEDPNNELNKKEILLLDRKRIKLESNLGGIREMGGRPSILFVIDTNKEAIAIAEAKKLGIPVIAIVDSNCNPYDVDYPIPGNDDAKRSIELYLRLVSNAVLSGIQSEVKSSGADLGEQEDLAEAVVVNSSDSAVEDKQAS